MRALTLDPGGRLVIAGVVSQIRGQIVAGIALILAGPGGICAYS